MEIRAELDPVVVALMEPFKMFGVSAEGLAAARAGGLPIEIALSDDVERTDHVVSIDPEVIVRVHRPRGVTGILPCLYSIHGGGYVLGTRDIDDPRFDRLCVRTPCVGVSVEYRLAPETPYPGPIEDCYSGLVWAFEHADELGIDPNRIGIGGTSAGGGLAAALALVCRDRGQVRPAFQLLECPMIDDRRITPSSQLDDLLIWSKDSNEFGWRSYLGDLYGGDDVPYHAAPSRCQDLSGLPPAFIAVGGADGFRDEDIDYAVRLAQAGVPTELHVYPGIPHGHIMFPTARGSRQWMHDVYDWLAVQMS